MLKIISGGQTGVDRAALDAAFHLGLPCGGFCPKGRKSEDGTIPAKYPLAETKTEDYAERTEMNVKTSDGTLILIDRSADQGTTLTIALCKKFNKPCFLVHLSIGKQKPAVKDWLQQHNIAILNIAGNRESNSAGIGKKAYEFLKELLTT